MKDEGKKTESGDGVELGVMCVAAQAYQVISSLVLYDKTFSVSEHERALDYFGQIANGDAKPKDKFLPWG